jgi:hypothetical protein
MTAEPVSVSAPAAEAPDKGSLLTTLARAAIAAEWDPQAGATAALPHPAWLHVPGAAFVTLTRDGALRGCIGSLEARRPLIDDLRANARAAAFRDPRFAPVTRDELPALRVEVSILSAAEPMQFRDEADALAQLRPGVDGVILEAGWHRATFLPQVWAQLPEPRRFLAHLKAKAGLPADAWPAELRLSRYRVEKYQEA